MKYLPVIAAVAVVALPELAMAQVFGGGETGGTIKPVPEIDALAGVAALAVVAASVALVRGRTSR